MHALSKIWIVLGFLVVGACASSKKKDIVQKEPVIQNNSLVNCTSNITGTHSLCIIHANTQENNFTPSLFYMIVNLRTKDVVFSEKLIKSEVSWETNEIVLVTQTPPIPIGKSTQYGYRLNINTLEKNYFNKNDALEEIKY
jgi:hypothetical protein